MVYINVGVAYASYVMNCKAGHPMRYTYTPRFDF